MKTVIFICTGNTCRSPMAQYLFAKKAARAHIAVDSAGLTTEGGAPASPHAVEAMREVGIDISGHRASPLTREKIDAADYLVAMGREHYYMLLHCGVPKEKLLLLGNGIEDPYGGDIVEYRACRNKIEEALKDLLKQVTGRA